MKRMMLFSYMLFLFYGHVFSQEHTDTRPCGGVLINGVCWAESNVDSPGTFAATPEAYGMYYQWNRKKGWPTTGTVTGWDSSLPSGDSFEAVNDPCPAGWRIPTTGEIATLLDDTKVTYVWTSQNGINGGKYTDKLTGNAIFLPATNLRNNTNGELTSGGNMYWSGSSASHNYAWSLAQPGSNTSGQILFLKNFGLSVRCVSNPDFTGCDSIVRNTSVTICAGDLPYTWGDTVFQAGTKTGKYRFRRTSTVTGCDSIVYLALTVNPVAHLSFSDVVCSGSGYDKNGFHLPVVVTDTLIHDTLQTIGGCDSIRSLYLTVNPVYHTPLYDTICQGDSYVKHGFSLNDVQTSSSYRLHLFTQSGCDSILSLHLFVKEHTDTKPCAGVLINGVCWAESNVDSPGTFAATPKAYGMLYQWNRKKGWPTTGPVTGWDSSVPPGESWEAANDPCPAGWRVPTSEEMATLLDNSKVAYAWISQNGGYGGKFTDKTTGNAIFLPKGNFRDGINGETADGPGGYYWSNLPSVNLLFVDGIASLLPLFDRRFAYSVRCVANPNVPDCDSIVRNTSVTICAGDLPYTWGDTVFQAGTKTGKYCFRRTSTVTGCDSIVYLALTVNPVAHLSFSDVVCSGSGYDKNGFHLPVVVTDTLIHDTLQTIGGCDSIRSLYLMVNPVYHTPLYDTICQGDSYYQHGFSLANVQSDGIHTLSLLSRAGCDSILSLQLTVRQAVQEVLYDSVCPERYIKNGFNLSDVTADGFFQLFLKTVHGCDSIVTLNLHVYPTYFFAHSETICQGDTMDFRGRQLYESGIYYDSLTTVKGCDSIYCMKLTVHPIPHLSFSDAVCSGSGYDKNGFNLPIVVTDTLIHDTLQTAGGCDSIRSLYLTVNPVYDTPLYDTICQGDSYYQHGFSLANVQSDGIHTLSLLSRAGCDSILSLQLTLRQAVQEVLYDSVCPSERYVKNGFDLSDVTADGFFQLFLKTIDGCDSIVTLNLHVYPTYFFAHSETICQGDTMDFRGRQLYESGIYYDSLATTKGCDSIYCINLTVNPVYTIQFSGILCEGSSYTENGFNVSQAGIYHRYLTTNCGCDSIITLNLTEEKKLQNSIVFFPEDCITHTYTFSFEPEIPVTSWQWDMGDGTILRSGKGVHTYADSGIYRIQLRTETFNGCENRFSYVQHVPYYLPEVQLQADRLIIDKDFPTVRFCAEVLPEMTCEWDFGDGTTGQGSCVSHTYNINTQKDYDVTLSVKNAEGCVTKGRTRIEVISFTKSANTFSPNGDGINDVFMTGYRMEIINRNGVRIYAGDNGWDGTYNGKQAPEDTYFYRLYYQTANGESIETGYVTLIR